MGKYIAKTKDGQEFSDLLERLNVDVDEYNSKPAADNLDDYLIAIETWFQGHDKLPEEVAKRLDFRIWTEIIKYGLNKNEKISDYANQERKKTGDFNDWHREMKEVLRKGRDQYDFALSQALSMGSIQQLLCMAKYAKDSDPHFKGECRDKVLQRIAELSKLNK